MASRTEPETKRRATVDDEGRRHHHRQDDTSSVTPPQPKRRRVADNARVRSAKACQRCRRLKEKCDGQLPCQRCSRSGRACEFAPAGMGGVPTTATTVRAEGISSADRTRLSTTGGGSPVNPDGVRLEERTKCLEKLVQHLLGDVPMDLNNLRRMAEKAGQRNGTGSDGCAARAGIDDMDDLTLEDENFTVKTLSQSTAHYSGEFSHWNFSQKLRRRLSQCLDSPDVAVPYIKRDLRTSSSSMPPPPGRGLPPNRVGMRIMEYWRATQLQSPKTLVQGVLRCLPPRSVSNFLVQIYFQFAQVNCFWVEEPWLRKKLEFLYEAPGHVTSEDSAWVCSVLMVLGIGTQFAHMAAGPPGDADGDYEKTSVFPGDSDSDIGVTFYQTASKLIPDMITIASIESVRAFLLLAHYVLPLDTQGLSYTYLGLGMKMAIQNGMHRRYNGTDLDAWTIETRNRLWWTAYTVERRVSVLHGRPASIAATEVDAELPKDMPEFRQHGDVSKFTNMSALIEMTLRLGDVANAITLLRRCPKNLQHTYFERIVDICQSLRAWWYSLPAQTRDPAPHTPTFRSNAHLKLSLLLNDIFVGRPFIFSHNTNSGTSPGSVSSPGTTGTLPPQPDASNANTTTTTTNDRPRNRRALASRAVEAAMGVIALLRTLHETTGLARSSYTEFSSCRAALLVMLAQSVNGQPQTLELKAALDVGMRLIRRMAAAGNVSTQSETSVIEALETAVRRLHEMQQQQQQQQQEQEHLVVLAAAEQAEAPGGGGVVRGGYRRRGAGVEEQSDPGKSGYERFREWASLWPPGSSSGGGQERASQTMRPSSSSRQTQVTMSAPPAFGIPPLPGSDQDPELARWLTTVDSGMGIGIEQLDDLGLFGGFPELGALDGWPGLNLPELS